MNKGTDFYGAEIAELIEEACRTLGRPREQLDIAVLETGSTGIFGLCKKKAHIRVQVKPEARARKEEKPQSAKTASAPQTAAPAKENETGRKKRPAKAEKTATPEVEAKAPAQHGQGGASQASSDLPPLVEDKLTALLTHMGLPSTVRVTYAESSILCAISGEHEAYLAGQDGKILENLQYLLRKMLGAKLPDRVILNLDAAGYRKQRLERLRQQAVELAAEVQRDGKTRNIPGLNPAERQAVHMALQQAGEVRSRSVGSGLFKKVLIYKSGKDGGLGGADAAENAEALAPADKHRSRSGGRRRD